MDNRDAMCVVLGGKSWPVPVLAAKQNKIIDPLILRLLPVFAEWRNDRAGALAKLDAPCYDALLEVAFVAVSVASPGVTREAFLELPITLPELITAFSVIACQTGVFQKENTPGEAAGAERPLTEPSTGTGSSPIPAI
jgi:hypothetical protein